MVYDPFASADHPEGLAARKLTRRRWPALFENELRSLDWKTEARKRPRSDAEVSTETRKRPRFDAEVSAEAGGSSTSKADTEPRSEARHENKANTTARGGNAGTEPATIMGSPPLADDRVWSVVNFMLHNVDAPNVEVEAKLGLLIEKIQERRAVELVPVMCETPLAPSSNADKRFSAEVGGYVFQHLNEVLNTRCVATAKAQRASVRHVRTKELDVYWQGRVRETRVLGSDDVYKTVRVQTKTRLSDLNVLCPGSSLDVRYSASREKDCDRPVGGSPQMQRSKDRISYRFEHISVDITACTRTEESGLAVTTHEVEVEVADSVALYKETVKYREGDRSSKVFEIAASLVNTVRLLLKEVYKAEEKWRNSNDR